MSKAAVTTDAAKHEAIREKAFKGCPGCQAKLRNHHSQSDGTHEIWKYRCGSHVIWLVRWEYLPTIKCLGPQVDRLTAENKRLRLEASK